MNAILDMKGTPERPDPTRPGIHIPVRIRLEPEMPFDMPVLRPARDEEGPRRLYLRKKDFKEFGFTEECDGCARLSSGMMPRPHTSKCRKRMEEEMRKTESGRKRIEEADMRVHEFLEEKLMEDHAEKDEERLRKDEEAKAGQAQSC